MLLSLASNRSARAENVRFDAVACPTMAAVARVMLTASWSPIVWQDGYRRTANFLSASLLVLDFDDGRATADGFAAELRDENMRFVLGVTRNHQKEKGGLTCDRFRVVMPFHAPVTDYRTYYQNMRRILAAFPCDQACADGARSYLPCTAIVAASDGDPIPWLPYEPPPPPSIVSRVRRSLGAIPEWIYDELGRHTPGEQHRKLFRVARNLAKYGIPDAEIISMIKASNSPGKTEKELERVGRDGIKSGKERP